MGEVLHNPDDIALCNDVFAWLQVDDDTVAPPLSSLAEVRCGTLVSDRSDMTLIRQSIQGLAEEWRIPTQLYVAGFADSVLAEIDPGKLHHEGLALLTDIFQPAEPLGTDIGREALSQPDHRSMSWSDWFPDEPVQIEHTPVQDTAPQCEPLWTQTTRSTASPYQPPTKKTVQVRDAPDPVAERVRLQQLRIGKTIAHSPAPGASSCTVKEPSSSGVVVDESDKTQLFRFEVPEWFEDALCPETDPEIFFPEKGGSTKDAKDVCKKCDVKDDCLQYALEKDERFGIWGGKSERERRKLKKEQKQATPTAPVASE